MKNLDIDILKLYVVWGFSSLLPLVIRKFSPVDKRSIRRPARRKYSWISATCGNTIAVTQYTHLVQLLLNIFHLTGNTSCHRLAISGFQKIVITALLISSGLINCQAAEVSAELLDRLDKRFQDYGRDYYQAMIDRPAVQLKKFKSLPELTKKVDSLIRAGKPTNAIAHVHLNRKTIESNIDSLAVIPLVSMLLEYNDWYEAKYIFDYARDFAGKPAISNISFVFAKYFMQRKNWQQASSHLDDVINELSTENANYARIMIGTILQYEKRHREAIKFYKKVPPSSRYYATAVLNTAIAYIRQDWWTDAHILINDTLKNHREAVSAGMADRLNLVLGYALLRKEYFRNSREVFRNISLHSPYTNRALLGIALTAANQDDYIGALNAITLLKDKKTTDLPVDEAYLLLPYTYGKLKQHLTASSAYTNAIKYYQERIASLNQILKSNSNILSVVKILHKKSSIKVKSNILDYSRLYPESFFYNYSHLQRLNDFSATTAALSNKYTALSAEYKDSFRTITRQLVSQRVDYLQSYMNQARYGLARLYDSSLISAK